MIIKRDKKRIRRTYSCCQVHMQITSLKIRPDTIGTMMGGLDYFSKSDKKVFEVVSWLLNRKDLIRGDV